MTPQQIEALNIAGQCRATASSPLAKNILVDEGNGLLTELLLDAARIIEALAQPEQPSVPWSAALESVWGEPEQEPVVHDPLPKACNLAGVDYQTFLKIKAYMPVAPPQPERHELQAKGEHPAPCARHCEANAFQIVIKNLKAQLAQPEQEPVAWMDADGNVSDNNDHKCFPIPLYTTPPQQEPVIDKSAAIRIATSLGWTPQRTWVDVPDEEIKRLWIQYRAALPRYLCFAKDLLSIAKEKNT